MKVEMIMKIMSKTVNYNFIKFEPSVMSPILHVFPIILGDSVVFLVPFMTVGVIDLKIKIFFDTLPLKCDKSNNFFRNFMVKTFFIYSQF